jgi:VWFA-related protein
VYVGKQFASALINSVMFLRLAPLAFACAVVAAQAPTVSITPRELHTRNSSLRPNLKIESAMVLVPVTVTDRTDHPVTDLAPDSFRIFEDNVEQKVVSFHREDGPVSVGFLFDASASMKGRMDRSMAAIKQFLNTLTKGDEFFLIRFSDRPTLQADFTEDADFILSELSFVQPQGWTALNDAICLGLHRMKHARNPRRALFVLTDGGDNNSRYSDAEVRSLARESDVRIYSIGLFERPRFLEKLAMDTGGLAIWAHKLQNLPDTVDQISRDFRNQYVLGYSPVVRPNDGKYHDVRVEIVKTIKLLQLNVFWRRGYFAPPE